MATVVFTVFASVAIVNVTNVLWLRPRRNTQLIRFGTPTAGSVEGVWSSRRGGRQKVTYSYQPAGSATLLGHTSAGWDPLPPGRGDVVTVFYDPRDPRRSVAYECCDFETDRIP